MQRGAGEQQEAGGMFARPTAEEPGLFDAEIADAQAQLQKIEADLLPEERDEIRAAQTGIEEADAKAAAIEEAAACLKDTGI